MFLASGDLKTKSDGDPAPRLYNNRYGNSFNSCVKLTKIIIIESNETTYCLLYFKQ